MIVKSCQRPSESSSTVKANPTQADFRFLSFVSCYRLYGRSMLTGFQTGDHGLRCADFSASSFCDKPAATRVRIISRAIENSFPDSSHSAAHSGSCNSFGNLSSSRLDISYLCNNTIWPEAERPMTVLPAVPRFLQRSEGWISNHPAERGSTRIRKRQWGYSHAARCIQPPRGHASDRE